MLGAMLCTCCKCNISKSPSRPQQGNGEDKDFILHYITKEVPSYRPKDQNNDRLRYAFGGGNEEVETEL